MNEIAEQLNYYLLKAGHDGIQFWAHYSGSRCRHISEFEASIVYSVNFKPGLHRETLLGKKSIVNQWIGQNLMMFYLAWQNIWMGISLTWYMGKSLSNICVVHCYKLFPAAVLHRICYSCYWESTKRNVKMGLRSLGHYGTCSSDQDYWTSSGRMMKKW